MRALDWLIWTPLRLRSAAPARGSEGPGRLSGPRFLLPRACWLRRGNRFGRLTAEHHVNHPLRAVPIDLERDLVARLVIRDHVAERVDGRRRRAVRGDDDVAADGTPTPT